MNAEETSGAAPQAVRRHPALRAGRDDPAPQAPGLHHRRRVPLPVMTHLVEAAASSNGDGPRSRKRRTWPGSRTR